MPRPRAHFLDSMLLPRQLLVCLAAKFGDVFKPSCSTRWVVEKHSQLTFLSFTIPDRDLNSFAIEVFDPQAQTFRQPQTGAIQQAQMEMVQTRALVGGSTTGA